MVNKDMVGEKKDEQVKKKNSDHSDSWLGCCYLL